MRRPRLFVIKAGIVISLRGYTEAKAGVETRGESAMTRTTWGIVGAVAGAAVLLLLNVMPSHAGYGDAPWCAMINLGPGEVYSDCQYQTFAACQPTVVAGNRGFCNVNPTYRPAVAAPGKYHARHRRSKLSPTR
jgi:hypothetical protein